jgi:uncharacterized protein with HEPN domain
MLSEKERGALHDMLRHIDLAEQFAQGHSYESLRDNLQALYAVIRSLEIISEASRRLSDKLESRQTGIPWREMAAAGNFYRHNYEDVTARRVWKTLHEDLSPLRAAVDHEVKRE